MLNVHLEYLTKSGLHLVTDPFNPELIPSELADVKKRWDATAILLMEVIKNVFIQSELALCLVLLLCSVLYVLLGVVLVKILKK